MATVLRKDSPHRAESPYVTSLFVCFQDVLKCMDKARQFPTPLRQRIVCEQWYARGHDGQTGSQIIAGKASGQLLYGGHSVSPLRAGEGEKRIGRCAPEWRHLAGRR